MAPIQLESLVDLRDKNSRNRYRRSLAIAALFTTTTIVGALFISGFFHYQVLSIDAPGTSTALAIRPDYDVSTFLYDRRGFRWFIGFGLKTALAGSAIFGAYTACVAVTAALGAVACGGAAVAVVATGIGLINYVAGGGGSGGVQTHDLELGDMNELAYVNSFGKRDEEQDEHVMRLMRSVFGADYQVEGYLNESDVRHTHLVKLNGGQPVRVHSFTSATGIQFHHSFVKDHANGGLFHRFGFRPSGNTSTVSRRADDAETTDEYFTSGGLDLFDCAGPSNDHLVSSDASEMESLIKCNDANFDQAKQLEVQIYDATAMGTIGSGSIAAFNATTGESVLTGESGSSYCPVGLDTVSSCPTETQD